MGFAHTTNIARNKVPCKKNLHGDIKTDSHISGLASLVKRILNYTNDVAPPPFNE